MEAILVAIIGGFVGLIVSTANNYFNPFQWIFLCGFAATCIYMVILCWMYQHGKDKEE